MAIAATPSPPYYAVIFTALTSNELEGYEAMAEKIVALAKAQEGFLGVESVDGKVEITVSYWESLTAIHNWKMQADHLVAQKYGKEKWYSSYKIRIAKVERDYGFGI